MKKTTPTYEEAMRRIEEIVAQMEQGSIDIDSLGARLKEAQALLALCRKRLLKAEAETQQILSPKNGSQEPDTSL